MGAVYVVEQRSTGCLRALKVMHPQLLSDERMRDRFVLEAKVGARIKSDHVVQVVGAGLDGGVSWLAMELLEGQDLASAVAERGALPLDDVREVMAQLGHALGAAHDAGIVHRDLKPENVFLATPRNGGRREGAPFTLKVLDFGVAKLVAEAQLFMTAAVGTPMWMAPEQSMSGGDVRPSSDVFALALIAYRLLTATFYWRSAYDESPSPQAILREVTMQAYEPASKRAARRDVAHRLPPGFDAWFARCTAHDPMHRPRDGRRACADFEALFGSRGAWSLPSSPSSRGSSSPRALPSWRDALTERALTERALTERALTERVSTERCEADVSPLGVTERAPALDGGRNDTLLESVTAAPRRHDPLDRTSARSHSAAGAAFGGSIALACVVLVALVYALAIKPAGEARRHVASAAQLAAEERAASWDEADRELAVARDKGGDEIEIARIQAEIAGKRAAKDDADRRAREDLEARLAAREEDLRDAERALSLAKTDAERAAAEGALEAAKLRLAAATAPRKPNAEPCECPAGMFCPCE